MLTQEEDFNFDENIDNTNTAVIDDKYKIKEILQFIDSSGNAAVSQRDIDIVLELVDKKKINFNNFEISIEEFIKKTEKYESICDVFELFGFVTKAEINKIEKSLNLKGGLNYESDADKTIQNINANKKIEDEDLESGLTTSAINKNVALRLNSNMAIEYSVMPYKILDKILYIACSNDIENDIILQILSQYPECNDVRRCKIEYSNLEELMDKIYNQKDELDEIIDKITKSNILFEHSTQGAKSTEKQLPRELIINLVDTIISNAVKMQASDIHIEPEENFVRLRYRIDGDMKIIKTIHKNYWSNILVRIKVLAGLNIAENRRPQDGKIVTTFFTRQIDCRVSVQPTIHGENIVIRILDKKTGLVGLRELGFYAHNFKLIQKANERPDGIIIAVGPTGSGKTTTLYSMINNLNSSDVNIMTLEDPVEYNIPMVRQININEAVGLTFESGMKSLVRQDPDIILIGEIRDKNTLDAALRMSMTGHKVFSSLHAIDSIAAIQRLMDIGADVSSLVGNITAIISQRLVKKLCNSCKKPQSINEVVIKDFALTQDEIKKSNIYTATGCEDCDGSGYKGRIVLAEVLPFNDDIDELVYQKASRTKIKQFVRSANFISMTHDARLKLLSGETSYDQIKKNIKIDMY